MKSDSRTPTPVVVLSRCLGVEACRYNGKMIREDFIHQLSSYVRFRPVCPELEIGLGVPRDPIQIIAGDGGRTLVQPATGRDLTRSMTTFSQAFLKGLNDVDGFILKSRSPSCGIRDTKIHDADQVTVLERDAGVFAAAVLEHFPDAAVEDEKRLRNRIRREHFLTRLFALARLRRVVRRPTRKALSRFHAANRLMLMAYNRTELDQLDRLLADNGEPDAAVLAREYKRRLSNALSRSPRYTSLIGVLIYALGPISKQLTDRDKARFLDRLERFRNGKIPASGPVGLLGSWVMRHGTRDLRNQTLFNPYPMELNDIAGPASKKPRQRSLYGI
ncbi:MAG: DUF523 and DUF1722 domain-containing protein [Acidobacteriota bacterium]|nr:DUF523 and DUF1722 domain-containing protein [Acidobacteriota bacterium]